MVRHDREALIFAFLSDPALLAEFGVRGFGFCVGESTENAVECVVFFCDEDDVLDLIGRFARDVGDHGAGRSSGFDHPVVADDGLS